MVVIDDGIGVHEPDDKSDFINATSAIAIVKVIERG